MPDYRQSPYFASAHRPKLMMGCDRTLIVFLLVPVVCIVYVWMTFWSLAVSILLFLAGRFWLQRLAKNDPLLTKTYLRSLPYRAYYPARSKYAARLIRVPKRWIR